MPKFENKIRQFVEFFHEKKQQIDWKRIDANDPN